MYFMWNIAKLKVDVEYAMIGLDVGDVCVKI